ncbi:hypothetical protein GGI07_001909 [Coemansia sp. Benny D115]|nr:hypothetical protein GGI07_001909 [Coemansia sp. Benny D115]
MSTTCTRVSETSRLCAHLAYNTTISTSTGRAPSYRTDADRLVRRLAASISDELAHRVSSGYRHRQTRACQDSVVTLCCSIVLPPCAGSTGSSDAEQPGALPHYSELLSQVSRQCGVPVDDLSDGLLRVAGSPCAIGLPGSGVVADTAGVSRGCRLATAADMLCVAVFVVTAWLCAVYLPAMTRRMQARAISSHTQHSSDECVDEKDRVLEEARVS